jgi:hypothetical protein
MAEDKKEFPWIQLIATVGTIMAALIGITPYILKLNTPAATPTIVILTLPPAVTTPAPATTPATTVETTPMVTQTTVVTTVPTTGPPLTETPAGNETATLTAVTTVATTIPTTTETTVATTVSPTTVPVPSIQISVNATSVIPGGILLASGSTDATVPQVTITLKNSTTFQSEAVPVTLTGGMFQFLVDTSSYAPGDYTIYAAVPETPAVASAPFVITGP